MNFHANFLTYPEFVTLFNERIWNILSLLLVQIFGSFHFEYQLHNLILLSSNSFHDPFHLLNNMILLISFYSRCLKLSVSKLLLI